MNDVDVNFDSFGFSKELRKGIADLGFETPTPIQAEAIPVLMEGNDVIGRARTGSGKTAAFGLPLLNRVPHGKKVRALVLAPTRELAKQVASALEEMAEHLDVRVLTIYGGAAYGPQLKALKKGVGIVVGTPGRVIDLMDRRDLDLSGVEYFVLDEADEMLRMGFIEDVEKILASLPNERQIALFSATMPGAIRKVANTYLKDPQHIQVEESALTVEHIDQQFIATHYKDKGAALLRLLAADDAATLVFARTRVRCAEVASYLVKNGVSAEALHGDLNQASRERVLAKLRAGNVNVVVATDVAARGLDVDHLGHVINYDIPDNAETYTHRIGRTGRAGRSGRATTFIEPRDRRRISNFARELDIKYKESKLPSDEDILAGRRQALLDNLEAQMESPQQERYDKWVLELLGNGEWNPEDLAAAALGLLAKEMGLDRDLPSVSQGPKPADAGKFQAVNETEVVLTVGRREGVRPGDVVGAIANEMNISSRKIGRISLTAHRTFVGLPSDIADRLLEEFPTITLRGMRAEVLPNQKDHKPVKKTLRARDERESKRSSRPPRNDGPSSPKPSSKPASKPRPKSEPKPRPESKPAPEPKPRPAREATKKPSTPWGAKSAKSVRAEDPKAEEPKRDDRPQAGGEATETEGGFSYIRRTDGKPHWKSKKAKHKSGKASKKSKKGKKRKSNKPTRKQRKTKGKK